MYKHSKHIPMQYVHLGLESYPSCVPLCCLQVCAVLVYAQQNNVEPFLEPVLQLADAMMARDASHMAAGASSGQLLHSFLGQLLCFMDLCTHPDAAVAVAASQCMAQLVRASSAGDAVWASPCLDGLAKETVKTKWGE
jgi:hypothetical protein